MFELKGKVAAITGAGSGIGQAIALLFAKQGAHVVILDSEADAGRGTAERVRAAGGKAAVFACDVSDAAQVRQVFGQIDAQFKRLDILANIAGIAHIGNVEKTAEADFDRVFRVNVKGVYLCSQAAVPLLLRQPGSVILNMASIASLVGVADRFAYSMSKGAVLTMTMSMAVDYMKKIRCNCICPARVHTPFVDGYLQRNYPGKEKEMFEKLSEYQPIGRMGTPEEVAVLALYLCSDESSFITGQAYPIDGGVLVS